MYVCTCGLKRTESANNTTQLELFFQAPQKKSEYAPPHVALPIFTSAHTTPLTLRSKQGTNAVQQRVCAYSKMGDQNAETETLRKQQNKRRRKSSGQDTHVQSYADLLPCPCPTEPPLLGRVTQGGSPIQQYNSKNGSSFQDFYGENEHKNNRPVATSSRPTSNYRQQFSLSHLLLSKTDPPTIAPVANETTCVWFLGYSSAARRRETAKIFLRAGVAPPTSAEEEAPASPPLVPPARPPPRFRLPPPMAGNETVGSIDAAAVASEDEYDPAVLNRR